ncbi:hypothetical protein Tco_0563110, partial [Tanacetum coccineum]
DEYADEEWYSLFIRGDRNLSGEMLVEDDEFIEKREFSLEVPVGHPLMGY